MTGLLHHPSLGVVKYSVAEVPTGGDGQTQAVVGMMTGYVVEDAKHPILVADLQNALAARPELPPHEAIYWWVKDRVRFVRDEEITYPWQEQNTHPVVEALIRPVDMIAMCEGGRGGPGCQRIGDCDDFSMYTAALLTAAGVEAKFATVAANPESTDFSHVYVVAYPNGVRVPMDTSHGSHPGWETGQGSRIQEWPIGGGGGLLFLLALGVGAALCR